MVFIVWTFIRLKTSKVKRGKNQPPCPGIQIMKYGYHTKQILPINNRQRKRATKK
jgi:hypothetical protein